MTSRRRSTPPTGFPFSPYLRQARFMIPFSTVICLFLVRAPPGSDARQSSISWGVSSSSGIPPNHGSIRRSIVFL